MTDRPLTPKQQRFVDEYLVDLNATQAYMRAGYKASTAEYASSNAVILLGNKKVASAIAERRLALKEVAETTQERIVKELARVAFSDMRRYAEVQNGVRFLPSSEWTDDDAAVVSEVSETVTEAGGTVRLKLYDKLSALDKLARHLGMFPTEKGGDTYNTMIVNGSDALKAVWEARQKLQDRAHKS